MTAHDGCRVSPFGHPRINAYVRLPEDYRSLSRPSSPVRAKASTVRPCSLDRISATHPKTGLVPGPPFLRTHSWCSSLLDSFTQSLNPGFQIQHGTAGVLVPERSTCEPLSALERAYSHRSRKEVIQPQVPLRLPCYDFAPVTELAFGGSLPEGLGHRLRALPTSMA